MLSTLIRKRLLVLLVINEIHLFVQFGLYFQSEFLQLRTLLFDRVRLSNHRTCMPVLFMTATTTAPMIRHLQLITGLSFNRSNIFWPSPIGMQCRSVCIKVRLNASVLNFVHKSIHPLCLSTTASKQWLLYGNSRFTIDPPAVAPPIVNLFKPIGCIATRALGAAGWDGRNIFLGMSCDLPTDLCSVIQEKGRAGRRSGSLPTKNSYEVCVSLQSYTYLLCRIHLAPTDEHVATEGGYVPISSTDIVTLLEYQTQQVHDLFSVL
jgi:hypothetical protein